MTEDKKEGMLFSKTHLDLDSKAGESLIPGAFLCLTALITELLIYTI